MSTHDAETPTVEKHIDEHVEYASKTDELVVDTDVKGYTNANIIIDDATNRRLLRLINTRVLPCMLMCYFAQALDKGCLGTASIMGLQADTGMVGQDYALTNTLLWVGVIIGEIPANYLVKILPLGKFISISLVAWGVVVLIMSLMRSVPPIFALRVILGLFESVSGPVLLATSVMWYKRHEQPLVVSGFQTMIGFQGIITSLLGYGFYHVVDKPLKGWQYMILMISIVSIILGIFIGWWMPDSPTKAKCFSEEDKLLLVERVRANDQGIKNVKWIPAQMREAFTDPLIYMLFFAMVLNTLITGGLGAFSALLINKAFGFDALNSQLLSIPTGVISMLLLMSSAYVASKTHQTIWVILALVVPNVVGTIVLITVTPGPTTRGGLLFCFYIMQCFQAQSPLILTVSSRNVAGQTKRVIAYGATFIGWSGGNAIASQLFQSQWAPRYIPSLYAHLGIYAAFVVLMLCIRALLVHRNKVRDRAAAAAGVEVTHLHAFEDLTDGQNPDFRYTL